MDFYNLLLGIASITLSIVIFIYFYKVHSTNQKFNINRVQIFAAGILFLIAGLFMIFLSFR